MSEFFSSLERLCRGRQGNVAITFALLLVPMTLMAGAGADFARQETHRVEMQDSLDRGVLAAASLTQTKSAQEAVAGYFKGLAYAKEISTTYKVTAGLNSREIAASASYSMPTVFLKLAGIETLPVTVVSTALEAKQNIELSLMLDMSGSMITNDRIGKLKVAAKQFVDAMVTDKTRDYTTISIVPYAGQVSVGKTMFDALGGTRVHSNSSCFELPDGGYGAAPPAFSGMAQVPHFTNWNFGKTNMNPWWCPLDSTAITYLSNDAAYLKAQIDKLEMHDGTGTQNAMQWGYMLLDPAARDIVNAAVANGLMPKKFSGRPAKFSDPETLKIIVLMTDGLITEQYRPKDPNRSVALAPDNKEITKKAVSAERLFDVCDAAKKNNVTVFTIGFEVTDTSQMQKCATSAGHFYPVSGLQISDAFKSIATSILKLKLTQ